MKQERQWEQVDGNLNINDLLKFEGMLPCKIYAEPEADGKHIIYMAANGCFCEDSILYKCKKNGKIVAISWDR